MIIKEWSWKNYKSYGTVQQTIKLPENKGELVLLIGHNGAGKCVEKNTKIDIEINDLDININLINYLDTTEMGKMIFSYIKESNITLYENIENYRKNT